MKNRVVIIILNKIMERENKPLLPAAIAIAKKKRRKRKVGMEEIYKTQDVYGIPNLLLLPQKRKSRKKRNYLSNIVYFIFPFFQEIGDEEKKLAIGNETFSFPFNNYIQSTLISRLKNIRDRRTRFLLAMNKFFRDDHLRQTNCFSEA